MKETAFFHIVVAPVKKQIKYKFYAMKLESFPTELKIRLSGDQCAFAQTNTNSRAMKCF